MFFRFRLQCRLIVAQMSNTRCEAVHWMTPIFVVSLIISIYMPFFERPLIYLLCILTTAAHWHYGTRVVSRLFPIFLLLQKLIQFFFRYLQVQQMCVHFDRECFGVKQPSKVEKNGVKNN